MSYCTCRVAVKFGETERTAVSLKCRSWHCPDCQPERTKRLIAQAHSGRPTTFLTLTSRRRDGLTAIEAARELTHAWQLIRKRLMRFHKIKKLPFLSVMEATKLGWPHLHILIRSVWLDRNRISSWMAELTDSPVVDIRKIDNQGRLKAYIAKYAGKCAHQFGTCKRYFQSRDYDLRSAAEKQKFIKEPGGWIIAIDDFRMLKIRWRLDRWAIQEESSHRITARRLC